MEAAIKSLLRQSGQIIAHQRELEEIRGEKFNVFSILSMETKEDATHSAFIGELLDPKGSHMMGAIFLEEFLKTIQHDSDFDASSAAVTREFYIGKVDLDNKTGGRIDILIKDETGQTISIENKIYAGDQRFQIERYVNYNKSNNTVYYLTLSGDVPADDSKGELNSKTDFHCLSYSNDIINWLEACQMRAVSKPVIRESIRQYILLLKKLTHQLSDNAMEDKVIDLIRTNYLAAKTICANIEKAELSAAKLLLETVGAKLMSQVGADWKIDINVSGSKQDGLSLSLPDKDYWICLEGDGFIHKSAIYFGIYADTDIADDFIKKRLKLVAENEYIQSFESEENFPLWKFIDGLDFELTEDREKLFTPEELSQMAIKATDLIVELKETLEKII